MQVKIDNYDDLGNGILKINQKVCFVKRAIPLEIVDIKIIKDKKNYMNASIKEIIKPSPKRIKPICKYYDMCGGCNFLHLTNSEEINFKIQKCKNYFGFLDDFYETTNYNYRDKVTLHVKDGNLGFYDENSHDLIKIDYCYLLLDNINEVIKLLNLYKDNNFSGQIVIRENYQKEIILVIEGEYAYLDILKKSPLITNLIVNNEVIKGNDYFLEQILNFKFKVSYNSFFQVNRLGLIKIFNILETFCYDKKLNTVLDLYSGTSVLGIYLSKYAKKVISIEVNSSATRDALFNLNLNHINNLEIINGKVEDYINQFKNISLTIVDPARRGLDLKTLNYLINMNLKYLIYIACSMDSLKRDLKVMEDCYDIVNLYAVDMFPRTNNLECVAILSRKNC